MGNNSKFDFKNSSKSNTNKQNETPISDANIKEENEILKQEPNIKNFKIGKKQKDKVNKKPFPLYLEKEKQEALDRVCIKTKYSRNELINLMIDFCLENLEYE